MGERTKSSVFSEEEDPAVDAGMKVADETYKMLTGKSISEAMDEASTVEVQPVTGQYVVVQQPGVAQPVMVQQPVTTVQPGVAQPVMVQQPVTTVQPVMTQPVMVQQPVVMQPVGSAMPVAGPVTLTPEEQEEIRRKKLMAADVRAKIDKDQKSDNAFVRGCDWVQENIFGALSSVPVVGTILSFVGSLVTGLFKSVGYLFSGEFSKSFSTFFSWAGKALMVAGSVLGVTTVGKKLFSKKTSSASSSSNTSILDNVNSVLNSANTTTSTASSATRQLGQVVSEMESIVSNSGRVR